MGICQLFGGGSVVWLGLVCFAMLLCFSLAKRREGGKERGIHYSFFSMICMGDGNLGLLQDMTGLLNTSMETINTMGKAHGKQSEVIKKTISINQDIVENIRNENEQFNSINAMAESNANDTTEVATQASVINEMVDKMTQLLKQDNGTY